MSVYKRPGAETYSFDFRWRGHRFHGSTGCTSKREAEKWEKAEKERIKAIQADPAKTLTFGRAVTMYWDEVGQHRSRPKSVSSIMGWLQKHIGIDTPITEIDGALVARLVALRRGDRRKMKSDGGVILAPVAAGTVNRNMLEPLRSIMLRAENVWGIRVQRIEWNKLRLKEPQERVREASEAEENDILALVPEGYREAVQFAILTGCRRAELLGLTWKDVNFFSRDFRVTGKGGLSRTIPMTQEVFDLLKGEFGNHTEAVFTYVAYASREGKKKGQRYPITKAGLSNAWGRNVRGKVPNFKFHDTRHTAATRLVRATGSIKLAQKLLGHAKITTTTRYAHVTHEDLRQALEAVSTAKSPTQIATENEQAAANGEKKRTF